LRRDLAGRPEPAVVLRHARDPGPVHARVGAFRAIREGCCSDARTRPSHGSARARGCPAALACHARHRRGPARGLGDAMTAEWNASAYNRVADPQARWGAEVLARLPLDGDQTVLDAGCGTGRVTEQLLARLPRGRVG